MFLFLPPNKSEFCTAEMSSLIRRCNGWTKADFSETRASGLMSFLTVWALPWSICSLASCGGGGGGGGCHCQQVCQLSNCQDIQFTWAWIFFLGNANTIEPFQQLFGAVFPRQSWPSELFILSRKLCWRRGKKRSAKNSSTPCLSSSAFTSGTANAFTRGTQ